MARKLGVVILNSIESACFFPVVIDSPKAVICIYLDIVIAMAIIQT